MNEPGQQRFRVLNYTPMTWIFLWGMFILGSFFVDGFIADRYIKLLSSIGYGVIIAVVYWLLVRYVPRWVSLNDEGLRIGKTFYSHSEIESISVEKRGKSVRISHKRRLLPISVFPVKSERDALDQAVTNWAYKFGITVLRS